MMNENENSRKASADLTAQSVVKLAESISELAKSFTYFAEHTLEIMKAQIDSNQKLIELVLQLNQA